MAFQPTAERRPQISSAPTQSSLDHHELYHEAPVIPAFSPRLHGGFREAEEREWVVFSPSVTVEPSNYTATEVETNVGNSEFWTEDTVSRLSGTQGPSYVDETEEEEEEEEADINDEEYNQMEYDEYQDDEDSLGPFIEHQRGHPVLLPAHDGRGMFPTGIPHEEESVIPGIASLEESLRLLTARNNIFEEAESLNSRIQRWREEHSTAFMEEIEMARKQKQRRRNQASKLSSEKEREEEMVASMMLDDDDVEEPVAAVDADEKTEVESENVEVSETFWRRITRSLMRDIMGIDDKVLEIIFGDTFPPLTTTSTLQDTHINDDVIGVQWERSLLETIARELGILLQQYTVHPTQGAFSTYSQQATVQLQNSGNEVEAEGAQTPRPRTLHRQKSEPDTITDLTGVSSLSEVNFKPTLSNSMQDLFSKHRAAMQGEPDRQHSAAEARAEAQKRKEYWEQELGVRVFFSYLKSRFSSNSSHPTSSKSARRAMATETHKPFYHQHPLIQRRHQSRKSTSGSAHSGQAPMGMSWGLMGMGGYRNGSSCASQSTKTSKRAGKGKGAQSSAGSVGTAAASTLSKGFYWEVETSVGSAGGGGSCVGVGPWGES